MLNIYVTRHGQDQDNAQGILNGHRDTPLTELGIKQAEHLSQKIKPLNIIFDAVYSSPLQRSYRTAVIIASELKLSKPEKLDVLIEKDFGEMTGKLIADIEKLCSPNVIRADSGILYFTDYKGAESWDELYSRAQQGINLIQDQHQNGNILLVTHGDLGKMLYASFYNLSWQKVIKHFHFGNAELVLLESGRHPESALVISQTQHNF